jgi:long-chain acyl-CoA synthetase
LNHNPVAKPGAVTRGEDVSELLRSLPDRISDLVEPWAERIPEQLAVVDSSGAWTYRELSEAISETRAWLGQQHVRCGDRVMIVCENCRPFVAILLALAGLDAWPVLVNARLSAREVDEIRDHCGARCVIYTTQVSAQAREHAKRHGAAFLELPRLGPIAVGALNESVEAEPLASQLSERVAVLIYTSGTTGTPKGVMLTHRNLLFVAAVSAKIRSLTTQDRLYGVLPMSHAVGLSVILLGTLYSGATCYLSGIFDPVGALKTLEKQKLTIFLGAPATFALIVEFAKLKGIRSLDLPALRIISCSGAPLHAGLKSEVEALFGLTLHHGFGVTECSPNILQTRVEAPRKDLSVGVAVPGVEVKLVGRGGNPVAEGDAGELWVRGPNIMQGYYRAPAETAAAVNSEGWFNTGDLARIEEGGLFVVGRTKDLIVRFGFNVYPAEVEGVLNRHPSVARSAVVGRTIEKDGNEEIIAFVQPLTGLSLTVTELTQYTAKHLAPYKQPSQIVILTELPLTPTGKVAKEELKKTLGIA